MGPSVGLVDGMRIGPDVAPWWRFNRPLNPPRERGRPRAGGEPSAENALRNIFTRAWMHNRLWVNDPDCLIARQSRTKLTRSEVQSLATAIALSGGMVLFSDDMAQLSRERLDICSLLLPPLGHQPVVPDLMDESMPSTMQLRFGSGRNARWLVGKFNWQRRRRPMKVNLPPGRWHIFELWSERYLGEHDAAVTIKDVPAHGVALLSLRRPRDRAQVIGTTFHYSMGAVEIASERWNGSADTLSIALSPVPKKRGLMAIHAPRGFRLATASLSGEQIKPEHLDRALIFRFELKEPGRLVLRFARS
jgi:alpha-galactosidase